MLRLIIADDESMIRETIPYLIDWKKSGIELVGVCQDGIEAYHMILDESPDIVMTDIRMPGLSGLDLVREVANLGLDTRFIILSGYEEFAYAREAMKYGVKYYLLKPCNKIQILESICHVRNECVKYRERQEEKIQSNQMLSVLQQEAMYHLISEGVVMEHEWTAQEDLIMEGLEDSYGQFFDFFHYPYFLYYVYYLETEYLETVLRKMEQSMKNQNELVHALYVKNTLLLFCASKVYGTLIQEICREVSGATEFAEEEYPNLQKLLQEVLRKVRRYDTVYVVYKFKLVPVYNNQNVLERVKKICTEIRIMEKDKVQDMCNEMIFMIDKAGSIDFLRNLINNIAIHFSAINIYSPTESIELFMKLNRTLDLKEIRNIGIDLIHMVEKEILSSSKEYSTFVEQIMEYVECNLKDSGLTLKKIAEQYLYMNVDYVSRQFQKSTGKKFSQYLMEKRIDRAKELLMNEETCKIKYVSEQVGCGENTQYFSQLFKKAVGMTPSKWAAMMQNK